jgi:nitrogen regulatory protein P-II 1
MSAQSTSKNAGCGPDDRHSLRPFYEVFTPFLRRPISNRRICCTEVRKGTALKKIDAVIRQENIAEVRQRLTDIGVEGLTITPVIGCGHQRSRTEIYRGCEYNVDLYSKLMLMILASDDQVDEIIDAIVEGARTGKIGDGKVMVTSVEEVVRIRTGEIGKAAV